MSPPWRKEEERKMEERMEVERRGEEDGQRRRSLRMSWNQVSPSEEPQETIDLLERGGGEEGGRERGLSPCRDCSKRPSSLLVKSEEVKCKLVPGLAVGSLGQASSF